MKGELKSMAQLALSQDAAANEKKWNLAVQHLDCVSRVMALDEQTRQVKHVISTGTLDRGNRMVDPGGWRLARFRDNPVVLANHDYTLENVIGRAVNVSVEGSALVATTEFASQGAGAVAFGLVQMGLVRAWSVGWVGLRSHQIGEVEGCPQCSAPEVQKKTKEKYFYGRHFTQQELLEYSLVAIPSNPDCVLGLQAAGLVGRDDVEAWMELAKAALTKESDPEDPEDPEGDPEGQGGESAKASVGDDAAAAGDEEPARVKRSTTIERSPAFYDQLRKTARYVERRSTARAASEQIKSALR
jgi:hypothetical protein